MTTQGNLLLRTPPPLQSLLMSLGSGLRYRRRFGAVFSSAMGQLEANERLSRRELLFKQRALTHRLLSDAMVHVAFFRRMESRTDDLATWPVLEKGTIRNAPEEFLSDRWPKRSLVRSETSGTTGSPLSVYCTEDAYQWEMAFRWRHRAWAGIPFGARGAYLSGHLVAPHTRTRPPFWVFDGAENRLLLSSYHLNADNLPAYVSELAKFGPEFIHGYPSSLLLVAQAALNSPRRPRPRAVFAASETLLAHQRAIIEEAFGCKVYVWYGQTEMTVNIVECERGSLHAREDYGVLETSPDGGAIGTGLRNHAMPFIRYWTGDAIKLDGGECECRRPFGLVRSIEGRMEDYVVTPNGSRIGRLDHLLKGVTGVVEAQILQDDPSAVLLRIVRDQDYSMETEEAIRREALIRMGSQVRLDFDYVESIPRGPGGKFRFVVSNVPGSSVEVERRSVAADFAEPR